MPETGSERHRRTVTALGIFLIAAALGMNEWLLGKLLAPGGSLRRYRLKILMLEFALLAAGLVLIRFRRSIDPRNLFLLVVSIGLTVGLCDLFLSYRFLTRSENPERVETVHIPDPLLGWSPRPGSVGRHVLPGNFDVSYEIDSKGFKEVPNSEAEPLRSLYFFGDSFTFGHGVSNENTFVNIIAGAYLIPEIHVFNAGAMGYGIVQMVQRFLTLEERIRPGDLIIFTPLSADIRRNVKDYLTPYRFIFSDADRDIENFPVYRDGRIATVKLKRSLVSKLKTLILSAPLGGRFFRAIHRRFIPDTIREAREMIDIIRRRTEARGGRFALIFLPTEPELLADNWAVDVAGFDALDIRPLFPRRKEELERLHFPSENHWNPDGHRQAARAVVTLLVEEGFIARDELRPGVTID